MQTNIKTNILAGFFFVVLALPFVQVNSVSAGSLSSDLGTFSLTESPLGQNETQFVLTLTPEPTDQVTTTFATNGECTIGHNFTNYATGGAIVTQNGSLPIGIRTIDDTDGEGPHTCDISFSSVSTVDPEYNTPATLQYSIEIEDDDLILNYGYSLSTLTVSRLEEGSNFVQQYQIDLLEPPERDITVSAIVDAQCDLLTGVPEQRSKTASSVFRAGSSDPVTFTLIPVQDGEFEGLHQCSVSHTTVTEDRNYQPLTIPPYAASIIDDDTNPNIPDEREYEGGLIYYRDANFDGIDDEEQPNVLSFINPNTQARQGLVITDVFGNLLNGCAFNGGVTSEPYQSDATTLSSTHGQISFTVDCSADVNYQILWLLDQYVETADDWTMYDASNQGSLEVLGFDAIVYNLGGEFTTALVVELLEDGVVTLLQTDPRFVEEPTTFEEALAADIRNDRVNPIMIISIVSASATILWLIWRRYFSDVDTTKSAYPRVDRF